jgi:hypothetical protein
MRRSVSWCAQSRDSKATFNNNLMQTWHYTFGPHAPQTQVLCGFLNRPTAATVEDGFEVSIEKQLRIGDDNRIRGSVRSGPRNGLEVAMRMGMRA